MLQQIVGLHHVMPEAKLKSPEIMGIKGEMPDEKGTSARGRLGRVVVILRIRVRY
jgi:hypothetical protein